ncbi:MAG: ferritin-like domain-containing protein [Planctomycetota bacterium]
MIPSELEPPTAVDPDLARARLTALLRRAHAGERAAFHAYAGHRRAVWRAEQRARIAVIAAEELEHRRDVGVMLAELGAGPAPWRERVFLLIGLVIHVLCRLGAWTGPLGWYAAMDGAGRLEARNVEEYVVAARHARDAGRAAWVAPLLHMARVEWEHERTFHAYCAGHWLSRVAPGWARPAEPPRALD